VSRALELTKTATWWPSVLWQTTTLALVKDGERMLVDPGIAPWEVREAAGDGVTQVLITHADWDHVMGIGLLPGATVHATSTAAERIRAGDSRTEVERFSRQFTLPLEGLDGLRVDELLIPAPDEVAIGPWTAVCHLAPGHTEDGVATWLPEERLLVAGDYLSQNEIPFIYDSAWSYRETLAMLASLIEREQPEHVVVGHGRPHDADTAMRIALEDIAYVERVTGFAESGGEPDGAPSVPYPDRGGWSDGEEHAGNIRRACEAMAGG
jgi:glyoxylase-like metal-dependent hydrolase (beta-lactamase superfamily II)